MYQAKSQDPALRRIGKFQLKFLGIQMIKKSMQDRLAKSLTLIGIFWLLCGACLEFYNIAWGTGNWLGQFSPKWMMALLLFVLACILFLIGAWILLWSPQKLDSFFRNLSSLRDRIGNLRWVLAVFLMMLPVWFLQYSYWGIVLHGPYLRILMFALSVILLGWLTTGTSGLFLSWTGALTALILISGLYNFCLLLIGVTSYPFSLGWSEGNRLWDYSILFGRHLYNYPSNQPIPVYLDFGRQLTGGIPFLISGINIDSVRLWLALLEVAPYLILGWMAYRLNRKGGWLWVLAGIWVFTFLQQGHIHPPLVICAIIVALVWERPLWIAIPLIALTSYFAAISRNTWLFAPGMWAAMLELCTPAIQDNKINKKTWSRVISVGLAGIVGGYLAPSLVPELIRWFGSIGGQANNLDGIHIGGSISISSVRTMISSQSLLWYRLFPNTTYGPGILIGLLFAAAPLMVILIHLLRTHRWMLNRWQKFAIAASLFAFLVVGLVASVKIGGGGDLHNLDMFFIGLMFTGALAWRTIGYQWIRSMDVMPVGIRLFLVALIAIPAYKPLSLMTPIATTKDIQTVVTLADISPADPLPDPLPETLPSKQDTESALEDIRREVARAASAGEVLFMDQRQLLTFGFIDGVPLVPDYDKKVLIDKAMSADTQYFEGFYRDLAAHRFSLIITSPLHKRLDDVGDPFGDENNAWVDWVAKPLLCYYQPLELYKKVNVQLLVPRTEIMECAPSLPNGFSRDSIEEIDQ